MSLTFDPAETFPLRLSLFVPLEFSDSPILESKTEEAGQPVFNYWREVAYPTANLTHTRTGQQISFPQKRIEHFRDAGRAMLAAGVRIPLNDNHILGTAQAGLGEITGFRMEGNKLFAKFRIVGEKNRDTFLNNDLSVGIEPEIKSSDGKKWNDAIGHIASTQRGQLNGMGGAIAASAIGPQSTAEQPSDPTLKMMELMRNAARNRT